VNRVVIILFLHTVVGEMVPRYVSLADPERTLLAAAHPEQDLCVPVRPVSRAIRWLGNGGTATPRVRAPFRSRDRAQRRGDLLDARQHHVKKVSIEATAPRSAVGRLGLGTGPLREVMCLAT